MSRGCLVVYPCGCKALDGRPYARCDRHKAEGGGLKSVPEQDEWLERKRWQEREAGG